MRAQTPNATFEFVAPDLIHMRWTGAFGRAEAETMWSFTEALKKQTGRAQHVFLVEVAGATGIDASARKKIAEITKVRPYSATAVVGASFPIKVAIELILNAARLLVADQTETRFFDTLDDAKAWIEEVRKAPAAA